MSFQIKYVYDLVDKISPTLKKIQTNLKRTAVSVKTSATKIGGSFAKIGRKLDKLGKKAGDVGKSLFIKATLPIALLGGSFVKAASDYQESINKVDVAFGKASVSVKKFSNSAAKNFGIDRGSALDMAAMFGDMSTSMGLSVNKAGTLSTSLVGLAGDLSSFKNIGVDQATTALAGVFTGETESLKKLGIVMTETNLKQFKMELGIRKSLKRFTQAEKVLLRYRFIMSKTKNSQGDFLRTNEGFANQLRILNSAWKDLSITLGVIILPLATKLIKKLTKLVHWFNELSPKVQKIILIVGGLVAVLGPLLIAISFMIPAIVLLGSAFVGLGGFIMVAVTALKAFMIANPLGLFIVASLLIINYWDEIVSVFKKAFNWISKIISKMDIIGKTKDLFGFGSDNNGSTFTQSRETINTTANQLIGGQLDINFANMPKGTNTNFTPIPKSSMNVGTSSTYAAQ